MPIKKNFIFQFVSEDQLIDSRFQNKDNKQKNEKHLECLHVKMSSVQPVFFFNNSVLYLFECVSLFQETYMNIDPHTDGSLESQEK